MKSQILVPVALAIALTGCQTTPSDKAAEPAVNTQITDADCGADKVKDYIGQDATDALRTEVASKSGASSVRWLLPNAIITMDLRTDRLNAHLGTDNKIGSFRCG